MIVAEPPIDIGRDEAAAAARRELAKGVYHQDDPGLLMRLAEWVIEWLERLLGEVGSSTPGGWAGIAIIAALVVIAAIIIRWRVGPLARARKRASMMVFTDERRTAAEHRAAAQAAASAGSYDIAIRESFRALVRDLEERTLLDERPGRTADEAAVEVARFAPEAGEAVRTAARIFDEVWYGSRTATRDGYAHVLHADELVQAIRRAAVTAS